MAGLSSDPVAFGGRAAFMERIDDAGVSDRARLGQPTVAQDYKSLIPTFPDAFTLTTGSSNLHVVQRASSFRQS